MSINPGSAEYNLNGLAEFLKGIAALNDPDKAKRQRVEANLADNPDLVQKYKQMDDETLSGILGDKAKFGSDKVAELIKKIRATPDSPEAKARKIKGEAIQSVTDYNAVPKMDLSGIVPGLNTNNIPKPATADQNIYNQSVGLPTVEEANLTKTQQDLADTNLGIKKNELNRITSTENSAQTARDYLKAHKIDAWTAYKDTKNTPPEVIQGLTADPDLKEAVHLGMTNEHYNTQEELQRLALSSRHNKQNLLDQAEISGALDISKMTGAPVKAILDLQRNPAQRQAYANPSFVPKTPEDEVNQSAAIALGHLGEKLTQPQINKAKAKYATEVDGIMKEVDRGKKDPNVAVGELNRLGSMLLGGLGIDAPTYAFDAEGDTRTWGLVGANKRIGPAQPKLYVKDGGDPRLGIAPTTTNSNSNETNPDNLKATAAQIQAKLDSGEADFQATITDPRSAPFRHLLRAPNRKKK